MLTNQSSIIGPVSDIWWNDPLGTIPSSVKVGVACVDVRIWPAEEVVSGFRTAGGGGGI